MNAPILTKTQRRLLSEWIRYKPRGGFMYGPSIRTAKALEQIGLMIVEDNGYLRGNPERWFVTLTPEGLVQAAARDESQAETEAFHQSIVHGRAVLRGGS
jgi:hypothetical protein